jgi:cytidylate kinase
VFSGVVALDGPSGTGKSTVARRLAIRLGARYLDTGAMYRAATLAVLRAGTALDQPDEIAEIARALDLHVGTDPERPTVEIAGEDVAVQIRSAEVTSAVSAVSAVPAVRQVMVARQRELIGTGGIVVEGRDIGSVVCPDARPKVYLTASAQVRAERRAGELGAGVDIAAVAADIERRDRLDSSRATSPLLRAPDAIEVDTTGLDIDGVVDRLVELTAAVASDA